MKNNWISINEFKTKFPIGASVIIRPWIVNLYGQVLSRYLNQIGTVTGYKIRWKHKIHNFHSIYVSFPDSSSINFYEDEIIGK